MKIMFKAIMLLTLISMWSCKSYVDDVNVNPNVASDAPTTALINAACVSTILSQEGEDARLGCMWAQQFTGVDRQYASLEIYTVSNGSFDWSKYYIAARNAKLANAKATAEGNKGNSGVAKVIMALNLGTVVAAWGDVPLSEAISLEEFGSPKFDGQVSAYASVQSMLDGAVADLTAAGTVPSTPFGYSTPAQWLELAHSLKARYFMHTKNYASAQSEALLGILDPANSFISPHTNGIQGQDMNAYYDFGKVNREGYMSAANSVLAGLLDPASPTYRGNAKTDEAARFANIFTGTAGAYDLNYDGKWAANAPFAIFDALETHLILAESASRSSNDGEAVDHLNDVRAILGFGAYDITDFNAGGIAAVAGKTVSQSVLREIVEERYVTLAGSHEIFNDMRRTKNELGLVPRTGTVLPQRFLIPVGESNSNANAPNPAPGLYDATPVNQ